MLNSNHQIGRVGTGVVLKLSPSIVVVVVVVVAAVVENEKQELDGMYVLVVSSQSHGV
jgi:hypothetical protein